MRRIEETEALLTHIEVTLRRLERENARFPGACCACLQDVVTAGHLPSCYLAAALREVEQWWSEGF